MIITRQPKPGNSQLLLVQDTFIFRKVLFDADPHAAEHIDALGLLIRSCVWLRQASALRHLALNDVLGVPASPC